MTQLSAPVRGVLIRARGCSVSVENEGDTLQDPVTDVLVCLDVSHEDLALAHSVLSVLSHVDWGLDRASQFQLVGLDRDDTNERHLNDELLRVLVVKAVFLDVPAGTLEEHAAYKRTLL